jgi:hypothetical protein
MRDVVRYSEAFKLRLVEEVAAGAKPTNSSCFPPPQ